MSDRLHVAVVGGGIAGITLTIALAERGVAVDVYEQGQAFSEIGAGVAFAPNSVHALKLCHQSVFEAFERVSTRNQWPAKKDIYFDFIDGSRRASPTDGPRSDNSDSAAGTRPSDDRAEPEVLFTVRNETGANSVHRGQFMDEMAKLVDLSRCHFGKRLVDISRDGGQAVMHFADGTTAEADAVIACDGINSSVRAIVFGEDLAATYTHKYAYRALVPMARAAEIVGPERAMNACLWMGPGAHILTFPVQGGQTMNLVGYVTDEAEWSLDRRSVPAIKQDMMRDFGHFCPTVLEGLEIVEDITRWAVFDLHEHPLPSYHKGGRACLVGDAAHASSPHLGAGAGLCVEDSAVLAALLADLLPRVAGASHPSPSAVAEAALGKKEGLEAAFAAFDAARRERTQWLVGESRRVGDRYEWREDGASAVSGSGSGKDRDRDLREMESEIRRSYARVWGFDVEGNIAQAREDLNRRLQLASSQQRCGSSAVLDR